MRSLCLAAMFAFAGVQSTPQTPTGVIEGRVLLLGTTEPVSNARVMISLANPNLPDTREAQEAANFGAFLIQNSLDRPSPPTLSETLRRLEESLQLQPGDLIPAFQDSTKTDSAGRFTFKNLSPGRYSIQTDRDGYFAPGATNITGTRLVRAEVRVEAGKPTAATELYMIGGGAISGVILDPHGQPVTKIGVGTNVLRYFGGRRVLALFLGFKFTNDRGEFRLFGLPPGQYFIEANPLTSLPGEASLRGADSLARTFYPGETDPSRFVPVTLKTGEEITGITFAVRPAATATYKISGTAINTFAGADPRSAVVDRSIASFFLVPHQESVLDGISPFLMKQNEIPAKSRPNGEFEIRNIPAGVYDLYAASVNYGLKRYHVTRTRIDVRDDLGGLSMSLDPGATLSAEVVVEGTAPVQLDTLQLGLLRPVDTTTPLVFTSVIGSPRFDMNGKITATDIPQGKYLANVELLPKGGCVTDIRQGGKSVLDTGFLLGAEPVPVQFVVNHVCETISGVVHTSDHRPSANTLVVLAPPAARRWNIEFYKTLRTDEAGRFSIPAVAPGAYTLYAWENAPEYAWFNAGFLSKYEEQGRPVVVIPGVPVETQLEIIPDDSTPN